MAIIYHTQIIKYVFGFLVILLKGKSNCLPARPSVRLTECLYV